MLDWLQHNASKIAAVIFIVVSIVRLIRQARENETPAPPAGDLEQDRREREVREKIRRRIRERQGGAPTAPETPPPVFTQPSEPVTLPTPARVSTPPPELKPISVAAEMERQQRLADELRSLKEAKVIAARRAAHQAAEKSAAAQTPDALRRGARDELLSDLREPSSLRRAVVLREVLGTPAGLR